MKRISSFAGLLLLVCCSTKSTDQNTKTSPSPDEPPVVTDAMTREASTPSQLPHDVLWGEDGTVVATSASVSVHARVHLKTAPNNPEPVVDLGQALSIVYAKQNTGTETLQVWHAGFWPNHRILVLDAAGKAPAMTEMGTSGLAAFSPRGMRGKNVEWPLKPGVVDVSEGSFDLTTLFTLTKAGRYTVQVDYEEEVLIRSNTLPFWLAPEGTTALIEKLNGWDAEEVDVVEHPDVYPGRAAAGESSGFIDSQKEELAKRGVTVRWDSPNKQYRIESIATP